MPDWPVPPDPPFPSERAVIEPILIVEVPASRLAANTVLTPALPLPPLPPAPSSPLPPTPPESSVARPAIVIVPAAAKIADPFKVTWVAGSTVPPPVPDPPMRPLPPKPRLSSVTLPWIVEVAPVTAKILLWKPCPLPPVPLADAPPVPRLSSTALPFTVAVPAEAPYSDVPPRPVPPAVLPEPPVPLADMLRLPLASAPPLLVTRTTPACAAPPNPAPASPPVASARPVSAAKLIVPDCGRTVTAPPVANPPALPDAWLSPPKPLADNSVEPVTVKLPPSPSELEIVTRSPMPAPPDPSRLLPPRPSAFAIRLPPTSKAAPSR